ncbi:MULTISPECIES: ABC transporter ATP-binding protein [Caproicibacterium]|uniref:ABC transporter ATP-binding protein n=1 Tax=Caproicibacterium argilliputei TaxID=3030016 RepID=A0AA97H3X8_9FIRM|nr:ABC transporter ATP-binding protein [Caproicibacterium argilliputei]WOC32793.1 ABC transporter ATP-binding protein [Caproicibacterium argilliputei]
MNAIEIKNLSKHYKDFSLDNVSFSLPSGCILGLIGENGAGKSTTIRMIMNTARRDSGEISVLGTDNRLPAFQAVKEDIGVVLDEANFPEMLTAKQVNNVMKYTFARWDEAMYFDYLKKFALPEKKAFKDFSRGMKMKLAIAAALSHSPKLLVLDEATGGLDPIVRDEILDIFNDFTRQDESHSILMSSHIVSDLEKLCDYIAFLHKGKLLFCEEKDRLLETYGVVHCSKEELAALPKSAVQGGTRTSKYGGAEALVLRSKVPADLKVDYASIEDIIVFLAKERSAK